MSNDMMVGIIIGYGFAKWVMPYFKEMFCK